MGFPRLSSHKMAAASAIRVAKNELRHKMKRALLAMSAEERRRQSDILVSKFISTEEYKRSRRIAVYLSMQDEVITDGIMKNILDSDRHCFIPRYIGPKMDMLRLYSMEDYTSLPTTKWNIKQPSETDEDREEALSTGGLDLILVPGLAFTKDGKRLGRGKGYYDSYLQQIKDKGQTTRTIALAFLGQMCEDIPTTEHDVLVDLVLHPDS